MAGEAVRDRVSQALNGAAQDLRIGALQFHVARMQGSDDALRFTGQRLLQQHLIFEEVGMIGSEGAAILALSRRSDDANQESRDWSNTPVFQEAKHKGIAWSRVRITGTWEPRVTLAVRVDESLRGGEIAYAVINLKWLWRLAEEFKLSNEGRVYAVDRDGKLIAAHNLRAVLKQVSVVERQLVKELLYAPDPGDGQFMHDTYVDQAGTRMAATGARLFEPRWIIVVEQPAALLFDPIKRKIWWLIAWSVVGVAVILMVARYISRKFTEPIMRLQQGTKQIASGSFDYRVAVEANDEIGVLADQFNQMAVALRKSRDELESKVAERTRELSALYTALTPLAMSESASQLLERVIERLVSATGADAGAIRLIDREQNLQISVAQIGFSLEHYSIKRPVNEGSADRLVFETGEPIIAADIAADGRIRKKKQVQFGYQSCAFLPLGINGEVRGIIHLASKTLGYFTEEQKEYLMAIARIMGVVAGNSELLQSSLRYAERLAHSNAELEQFAYAASHDLQEPLRMITGYTQLLAKRYQGKLDKDADEFIGYAADGARRMNDMIKDLLAYSRLGTQGKQFEPTDCEVVFRETLAGMQVAIQESGAKVTHDPLPTVSGDGIQLGRLFQNLVGNAVKYRNGNAPEVRVTCARRDKDWLFSVIDNGIGIDPQHAERIFVIFQRLHTGEQYQGTGIGLASCKKIVERHGGTIWVKSEPGKGSTFYFSLPA